MTPASVNRRTGEIKLFEPFYNSTPDVQDFILAHEQGHYIQQTSDELKADSFASSNYFGSREKSLKNSLRALSQFLDVDGNEAHNKRFEAQLKRALAFDYVQNNNEKALNGLIELRKASTSNFDGTEEKNIGSTSGGFVWGFFSTIVLIIAVILLYKYLRGGF